MLHWTRLLLVAVTATVLAACGGGDDDHEPKNIVQTALADPQFSTLVAAVSAAELVDALSDPESELTVFAPTNAAFELLLDELGLTQAQLLADKDLLTAVLTYHVLPSRVAKADVPAGRAVTTLQGGIFKVEADGDDLVITDGRNRTATITATDIEASNGVIHVIDRVILPANRNIVETAVAADPEFSILVAAVTAAGLGEALSADGPLTVFAPTNAAFEALLVERNLTLEELLADTDLLTAVLTYHVVDGRVLKADVPVGADIPTLQGGTFTVDGTLAITDANGRTADIVSTDVLASNGVIHVIDRVILPAP